MAFFDIGNIEIVGSAVGGIYRFTNGDTELIRFPLRDLSL
jgi:hypothetical protein